MKVYNQIQILSSGDLLLTIDPSLTTALGLREGTLLTGFALGPNDSADPELASADEEGPDHRLSDNKKLAEFNLSPTHSIVLSPFPLSSWGRLLRASLTCTPTSGALSLLHKALHGLGIICHYTETTNGLDLNSFDILSSEVDHKSHKDHRVEVTPSNLVIPSTIIFFEIVPSTPPNRLHRSFVDLIRRLARQGRGQPADSSDEARERGEAAAMLETKLREELDKLTGDEEPLEIRVDWVSPMEALNRLSIWNAPDSEGEPFEFNERAYRTESLKERRLATLFRARSRKKVLVEIDSEGAHRVSLAPWQRVIWPLTEKIPDELTWEEEARFLALGHVDSNQKVLVWDLFKSPEESNIGSPIVSFELLYPAGLLEPCWWQFVFEVVKEAGGNILTCVSSGRLEGHWASLNVTAALPLDYTEANGGPGDISRFIQCFRTLQGQEGLDLEQPLNDQRKERGHAEQYRRPKFEEHCQAMRDEAEEFQRNENLSLGSRNFKVRVASTVRNITVWDPQLKTVERPYTARFKPNPFSFTHPLNETRYDLLYPGDDHAAGKRTRAAMAKHIIERITLGENIAIVGAHRSGKTSVLNLVSSYLEKRTQGDGANEEPPTPSPGEPTTRNENGEEVLLIPLPINAALVPPQAFFPEIAIQLYRWSIRQSKRKRLKNVAHRIGNAALGVATEITNAMQLSAGPVSVSASFDFSDEIPDPTHDLAGALRQHLWTTQAMNPDKALDFMSRCLEELQAVLAGISQEGRFKTKVVVIVDEIGRLTGSEFKPVLQGWRHVIESSSFDAIRWLISASRPIEETKELSPITNVFKEYNVGSLRLEETKRLLNIFGLPHIDDDTGEYTNALRPVLTYNAGVLLAEFTSRLPYFLQVVCYHLYDRSTRSFLPIVNRQMCKQVIRQDVLPEISDYLEYQWEWIPDEVGDRLGRELESAPPSPTDLLEFLDDRRFHVSRYPALHRKALLRAGLKGDDSRIVAPIVAFWLTNPEGKS